MILTEHAVTCQRREITDETTHIIAEMRPVDGPFGDYSDPDGYRAQARRSAILGCEGKWAIHPSQVALANDLYTPPADEVKRAKRILKEMKASQKAGAGAVSLDGKLIDAASIKQADVVVNKAKEIAKRDKALAAR